MSIDLSTTTGLLQASRSVLENSRGQLSYVKWVEELEAHLVRVREAGHNEFVTPDFQRRLWESEAISATGMGHVDVSRVINNPDIAEQLWELRNAQLPSDPETRGLYLSKTWDELKEQVSALTGRIPRLKMNRVFAALRPAEFTTVVHISKLKRLARAIRVPGKGVDHPILLHRRVLDRISDAFTDAGFPLANSDRMTLPWLLYVAYLQDQGDEATETAGGLPGDSVLNPLPANRRRRGMLAIAGLLPTVLAMIEFAKEGCKREDFREHIRSICPQLAPSSVGTNLNALIAEWGVLKASGDELWLTPRGEALLETGDPEEVADWLLTRILGFDNVLYWLRAGPRSYKQLIEDLQGVNPGWTSNFAPTALLNWVRGMGLAEAVPGKVWQLSERGQDWASRIHWTPGVLPTEQTPAAAGKQMHSTAVVTQSAVVTDGVTERPSLNQIISSFPPGIRFDDILVGRLDAGLWSHHRRHFAVLTGLSGAGKTLLAKSYANGLWSQEPDPDKGLCIVPVQPGWHDPTSLLGYLSPLENQVYVRTAFLAFLLDAIRDPDRPYTVILDEMNLSHPEQYLAPLLSAMETGGRIELHAQGDEVDGVPASVPYPSNLLLIGTVNMDETTHGLSDKVLDRAAVIEFWDIDVDAYPGWSNTQLPVEQVERLRQMLKDLVSALRPVRLHFGWRTIDDVIGYVRVATAGGVIKFQSAMDHAVYAKVLPKLRGEDTPRLQSAFAHIKSVLAEYKLPESEAKLKELLDDLTYLGSARFWR